MRVEEIMNTDELKHFTDPLLGPVSEARNGRGKTRSDHTERSSHSSLKAIYLVPLFLVLGILAFFLYQAQEQIGMLSDELNLNKGHLDEMSTSLKESQVEIKDLNQGLQTSKDQLTFQKREINQYKNLYNGLKSQQADQTREIATIGLQKADREEVHALRNETAQLQEKVTRTEDNVTVVRQQSDQNRARLDEANVQIAAVQESVVLNRKEIAGVKRSLEREYYNFELQEKGGYMKVFDVSLSLKDTDWRKRQFDMYLMADGKVMQKKDQSVNEPIVFYIEGQTKPYEVVVTRVEDKMVVGYLSVPKG